MLPVGHQVKVVGELDVPGDLFENVDAEALAALFDVGSSSFSGVAVGEEINSRERDRERADSSQSQSWRAEAFQTCRIVELRGVIIIFSLVHAHKALPVSNLNRSSDEIQGLWCVAWTPPHRLFRGIRMVSMERERVKDWNALGSRRELGLASRRYSALKLDEELLVLKKSLNYEEQKGFLWRGSQEAIREKFSVFGDFWCYFLQQRFHWRAIHFY